MSDRLGIFDPSPRQRSGAAGQSPSPAPRPVEDLGITFDHGCFACGHQNLNGMRVEVLAGDGGVEIRYRARGEHTGYEDALHGGVLAALADEAMAWTTFLHLGTWGVTTRLATTFRLPAAPGEELRATARIERDRGRAVELSAEVRRVADGALVAEGTGTYVKMPAERVRALVEKYGDPEPIRRMLALKGAEA